MHAGRPWRSVFDGGGGCSSRRSFFGHDLEQNSHILLDSIQFQLEEAFAGVDASDSPPPVTDVPSPRHFSPWDLAARRGDALLQN